MGIKEIISEKKEQILALGSVYGAYNIRVFGSVANGFIGISGIEFSRKPGLYERRQVILIWNIVEKELPALKKSIRKMLD